MLCLDAVGQLDSAALDADQRLVRELQDGAETPAPLLAPVERVILVERLGDTALLSLEGVTESQPSEVLIMKTAQGWRIRDYVEP